MELNNLKPAKGSTHHQKRIGRGAGSGHGGTATRGHKGAQSRSGYSRKLGFEGGQMPLQRRLPKFGFTNINRVEFKAINLSTLEELASKSSLTEITFEALQAAGFASRNDKVKILGNGSVSTALKVTAHAFSKSAEAAIVAAGGSVEKL
ncbi:MAG: 50S ribosomal protein L15 [Rikenellaceae bacterium]